MNRTSRMMLVVVLVATGSVLALSLIAHRYTKILARRPPSTRAVTADAQADREVAAFLRVREEVGRAVQDAPRDRSPADVAAEARARSLFGSALDRRAYDRVEQLYGAWSREPATVRGPYAAAFERNRDRLARTAPAQDAPAR